MDPFDGYPGSEFGESGFLYHSVGNHQSVRAPGVHEMATVNIICAITTLVTQALQTQRERYLLYKDPVFPLAPPFVYEEALTPC